MHNTNTCRCQHINGGMAFCLTILMCTNTIPQITIHSYYFEWMLIFYINFTKFSKFYFNTFRGFFSKFLHNGIIFLYSSVGEVSLFRLRHRIKLDWRRQVSESSKRHACKVCQENHQIHSTRQVCRYSAII